MISYLDLLSDLAHFQRQDRLREAEMWRLAREARPRRAKFLGRLLPHLLAFARKQLRLQARPSISS